MFCQNILSVGRECYKNAIMDVPVKEKRSRTAFTAEQLNYLEQEYKTCPYSEHDRLCNIANIIRKPEKVVKIWFQNRRSRERKSYKQSVMQKKKLEIPGTNKSITTPNSNLSAANKPTSVTQIDYNSQFCYMTHIQNIMSKTNQLNRNKDFNTSKQAVNLHKIINNVRKEAYPKSNPANCKDKMKTKTKMSTPKMNKNTLANTRICYAHPKTTEIKSDYKFAYNNSHLPNSSNFFISGNNSAINFAPKEIPGFPSKSVSQNNFNYRGLKQEKNMPHNMFQIQETRKSPKKCSCNCKPKSKQTGVQKIQNPQVPYVIIIPCLK